MIAAPIVKLKPWFRGLTVMTADSDSGFDSLRDLFFGVSLQGKQRFSVLKLLFIDVLFCKRFIFS